MCLAAAFGAKKNWAETARVFDRKWLVYVRLRDSFYGADFGSTVSSGAFMLLVILDCIFEHTVPKMVCVINEDLDLGLFPITVQEVLELCRKLG